MYPLVTCAIPLYRSKRFVDRIVANVEAITYPNTEILISDQHCEDHTLAELQRRLGKDSRVRFIGGRRRVNWVEHYNLLLDAGRGTYFRWMPHDDEFPVCVLTSMVEIMQANSGVVLVYGPVRAFDDARAFAPELSTLTPNPPAEADWTFDVPIFLNFRNLALGAFKGLFRRDLVLRHRMTIRPTYNLADSERVWLMGVALLGRFHFLPSWQYRKYYGLDTTSRRFVYDRRVIADRLRISIAYLYLAKLGWRKFAAGATALALLTLRKLFPGLRLLPSDNRIADWLRRQ